MDDSMDWEFVISLDLFLFVSIVVESIQLKAEDLRELTDESAFLGFYCAMVRGVAGDCVDESIVPCFVEVSFFLNI